MRKLQGVYTFGQLLAEHSRGTHHQLIHRHEQNPAAVLLRENLRFKRHEAELRVHTEKVAPLQQSALPQGLQDYARGGPV